MKAALTATVAVLVSLFACSQGVKVAHDNSATLQAATTSDNAFKQAIEKALKGMDEATATEVLNAFREKGLCLASATGRVLPDNIRKKLSETLKKHNIAEEALGSSGSTIQQARHCVFMEAHKMVDRLRSREGTRATFDVNHLALFTEDEFRKHFTGFKADPTSTPKRRRNETEASLLQGGFQAASTNSSSAQSSKDWVGSAISTVVQNQASCGGCWAFSASETIAAMNWIENQASDGQQTMVLSAQQLISCDTSFNEGCSGGNYERVWGGFSPYSKTNPLTTVADYPYADQSGQTSACDTAAASNGYVAAYQNNQLMGSGGTYPTNEDIYNMLLQNPASIAIVASASCFQYYTGGLLTVEDCATEMAKPQCSLDHAIQIVGFQDYGTPNMAFKVKNSWGTTWGDGGYAYFANDYANFDSYACNGLLGINMQIAFPSTTNQLGTPPPTTSADINQITGNVPTTSSVSALKAASSLVAASMTVALFLG